MEINTTVKYEYGVMHDNNVVTGNGNGHYFRGRGIADKFAKEINNTECQICTDIEFEHRSVMRTVRASDWQ